MTYYQKQSESFNLSHLSLLEQTYLYNIFQKVPRTFEICTNDGSCYFNTQVIQDISYTIRLFLQNNPDAVRFNISLDNNKNLKKIEELCQGKLVIFNKNEFHEYERISNMLQIHSLFSNELISSHRKTGIILNPDCNEFLFNSVPINFIISTKKQEYLCNNFGICSSKVILDFINSNPNTYRYEYDYPDEFNEFQQICDLFNFEKISITTVNLDFLKEIAEDLQIDFILDKIKDTGQSQDKMIQKVDRSQKTVDKINELFDLLYKINELSVKTVRDSIIESKWSKSEENVQELAAFILQVIQTDELLHPNLLELLFQLDSENLTGLKILLPFIKNKLLKSLDKEKNNCAFTYRLYKKGVITKEELISKLKELSKNQNNKIAVWFLPELIENECFDDIYNNNNRSSEISELIKIYLPDKIDLYRKMRDSFEPDDEITKALRIDDVDTFQSIISIRQIKDISKCYVPYNIFDSFSQEKINYINYAAAFGSIKCFKYLMLNHSKIDLTTFYYSIHGGNNEIIKIVDNNISHNYNNDHNNRSQFDLSQFLITLIKHHRNNLFDWFFEHKITKYELILRQFDKIVTCSVSNGNAHALVSFIDKGFNIFDFDENNLLSLAASKGFYHLLKFLYEINGCIAEDNHDWGRLHNSSYVSFGNLKIFKFYINTTKQKKCIIISLENAIEKNEMKMVDYFIDEQKDKISVTVINSCLIKALEKSSDELFYNLLEKFKTNYPSIFESFKWNMNLLEIACKNKQIKPFYTIIKFVKIDENTNFTFCLLNAACSNSYEICKYIIDNKYKINYLYLFQRLPSAFNISYDLILLLFNNSGLEIDKSIFLPLLPVSISYHNKNFVKFLLEKKFFYDEALIDAVAANNLDIVNIILDYKSDPFFINRGSEEGTALHIAVKKNNLKIVKKLLSIPSIKLISYDKNNLSPFNIATLQLNIPIIKEFISLFGKNILLYQDSINYLFESIFKMDSHTSQYRQSMNRSEKIESIIQILELIFNIENIQTIFDEKLRKVFIDICTKSNVDVKIIKAFLKFDSFDVNYCSAQTGETVLTLAVKASKIDIIKLLINHPKTNVNMINSNHETPLYIAVKKSSLEIVNLLLSVPSININLYDKNNYTPLMIASNQLNFPIINEFLTFCKAHKKIYKESFYYLFDSLIKGSLGSGQGFIINRHNNIINNNTQEQRKENCNKLLETLLNIEGINQIFDEKSSRILLDIFSQKVNVGIKFIQNLLKIDALDVNITSPSNGNTPLILALKGGNFNAAEFLIKYPKTNINMTNYNHESALTVAVEKKLVSIVKLLINDPRFDPIESRADYAFVISKDEISEILLSMNLFDVNCIVVNTQRTCQLGWGRRHKATQNENFALIQAVESIDLNKFEFIIKHPTFDKVKSKLQKVAKEIFAIKHQGTLCSFVNILNSNGLLDYCFQNIETFESIMENNNIKKLNEITDGLISNLIISDDFVIKLFESTLKLSVNSINSMSFFVDYDKEHNNVIDFKNNSFLTCISKPSWRYKINPQCVVDVVNFIIENGDDVNKPNKKGIYPLQHAILTNYEDLVRALLKAPNINLNQLIDIHHDVTDYGYHDDDDDNDDDSKYEIGTETYLHLAARVGDPRIFKLLLNLNVYDINVKNSNNNTPLMLSCEFLCAEIVKLLFKNDSLDFHCKNNKNEDALAIVQCNNKEINKDELDDLISSNDKFSKEQYFNKLVTLINEKNCDDDDDDDNLYSEYDIDDLNELGQDDDNNQNE